MNITFYNRESLLGRTSTRPGETKVGEQLLCIDSELLNELNTIEANYILLGITEDIGVRANHGRPGTSMAWEAFLNAFLNVQANAFLPLNNIALLGCISPEKQMKEAQELNASKSLDLEKLRSLTTEVDELVWPIIKQIVDAGKTPLVIGGGHNNAYPIIKGVSKALDTPIQSINCDPHSDFRAMEGRHSGNGFSYAMHERFLKSYGIVGLHEGYNSEQNLSDLKQHKVNTYFFEDAFVRSTIGFAQLVEQALKDMPTNAPTGLELDLDSIAGLPVSAFTPSGLRVEEARQYVNLFIANRKPVYVHFCEGAPALGHQGEISVGKVLSYLVQDVLKATEIVPS
jgi:formiminoglutamase